MTSNQHSVLIQIDQEQLQRDLEKKDLFSFFWHAFELLQPGVEFLPSWHIMAICHALTRVTTGETKRLLITVPPRYGKSIATSVCLPAFLMGHDPCTKIMVASYGSDLASNHARDFRTVITSPWYQALFPGTIIKVGGNRLEELVTTRNGVRKAISRDGAATGFGADWIIVDDIMKAGDANSELERRKAIDFYRQTLLSRLNNKVTGRIIVIAQRLHGDDLNGNLIESGEFEHLFLPVIATKDQKIPIGYGKIKDWHKDDILWPEREPLSVLREIERAMGKIAFSTQYLGDPTLPGGNRIRWEWFGQYDLQDPQREDFVRVVQSWDTAYSSEPTSDFSVGMCWGLRDGRWYLVDLVRERLDFPDLKRRISTFAQRWTADIVLIEQAGSGIPLWQQLHQDDRRSWIYRGVLVTTAKQLRLEAQTARLETGRYLLPPDAPWMEEFRRELLGFPNAAHDDQVDALSQFVEFVESPRGSGIVERDPLTGRPTRINRPSRPTRPVIVRPQNLRTR